MKPIMPAPVFTQSTQDALNLLGKAEDINQAVQVTPKGNIKILHQKPGQLPASKLAVVQAVLNKMQNEASELGIEQSGSNALGFLTLRMPSLNLFAVSGKLGNLREEWQQIKQEHKQPARLEEEAFMQFSKTQKERLKVVNDMSQVLPAGFDISIEDGAISKLEHVFSESAQNQLLACARSCIADPIDKTTGLDRQTMKDLHRQGMTFILEQLPAASSGKKINPDNKEKIITTKKEFKGGKEAEKIAALHELCGNNQLVARTVSALTNQEFLKAIGMYFDLERPTPSGYGAAMVTVRPMIKEEILLYTLRRKIDGDVELTFLYLWTANKLISNDGKQEWKINSGEEFRQPLSETNFSGKRTAQLLLKKSELKKGILNPVFSEPATQSLKISPDFQNILKFTAAQRPAQP